MRNTLGDLNNHLFMELERLNEESLSEEELQQELKRAKAMTNVAGKIIDNGKLVLDAQKFMDHKMDPDSEVPRMLEG